MHSGMFGGPAPDALLALISMLATLRDARGNTTIQGLDSDASWQGVEYPAEQFRADAHVLDGVELLGDGSVADMLWSRPAVTVLGIDCPPVVGSAAAMPAQARARVSLRVPPGIDAEHARGRADRAPARGRPLAREGRGRAAKPSASRSPPAPTARPTGDERGASPRPTGARRPPRDRAARSPCATSCTRPSPTPRSCSSASRSRAA